MKKRIAAILVIFIIICITYIFITKVPAADKLFEQGLKYEKSGQYDEAIKAYTEIIKLYPNRTGAYYRRAQSYEWEKNYDMAIQDYSKYLETAPEDSRAYESRARSYEWGKNYNMAIQDYNKIIELFPDDMHAYAARANLYKTIGRSDLADLDCKVYEKKKKSLVEIAPGLEYEKNGQYGEAIKAYTKIIKLDPNHTGAYYRRAQSYARVQNYEMAIQDYSKIIEIKPDDSSAYENRAKLFEEIKNYEMAIQDYSKCFEMKPGGMSGEAYQSRAELYKKIGRSDLADADYKMYAIKKEKSEKENGFEDYDLMIPFVAMLLFGSVLIFALIVLIIFSIYRFIKSSN